MERKGRRCRVSLFDTNIIRGVNLKLTYFCGDGFNIAKHFLMSILRKNNTKTPKCIITFEHPDGEVVVITKTTVKGTLFPEKLEKANAMLKNAKFMNDK